MKSLLIKSGALILPLLFMGCSMESQLIDLADKEPDFLKSELLATSPVPADGSSELFVYAHFKNSDNSPVPSFKPESEIVDGNRLSYQQCTTSDKNGVAICTLRATVAGIRTFKIKNIIQIDLKREVEFQIPSPKFSQTGIVSGALNTTTASGHRVSATISYGGSAYTETAQGYKVFRLSEGVLFSE